MTDEAKKSLLEHAAEVAEHQYDVSDYDGTTQIAAGTAETHEQFSDSYAAGTSDGGFTHDRPDASQP
ncbi:YozQ family protein [Paenibacillus flagellatus]|uniref:DUF4025 domain-containing protein n=1 Tax=Paenibacillus flagellatus TaxID=2211139 RepID=A0A2V5KA74_9BACL|nr:YozQ family protein [Paenibacillus flagellatus]PYI56451.1 DUF4025 domain-containing protein [Paenibacillus flagellatus]